MKAITYILLLLLIFLSANSNLMSQDKRPVFIGIQPSFTRETFYEEGEFDINVVQCLAFTFRIQN